MNEDFRLYVDLFDHPKIRYIHRFYGALGVYCLIRLWAYATRYFPDGELRGMDLHDVEVASTWTEHLPERPEFLNSESFAKALLETGFLDGDEESGLRLHDWDDWQPWVIKAPERKAAARAAGKASAKARAAERQRSVQQESNAASTPRQRRVAPNSQIPDPSTQIQKRETTLDQPAADRVSIYSAGFLRFWGDNGTGYPRKVGKGAAWKSWHRLKCEPLAEAILAHVAGMKQSESWQKDGGQFIPFPATYLNQRRWEDPLPTKPEDEIPDWVAPEDR